MRKRQGDERVEKREIKEWKSERGEKERMLGKVKDQKKEDNKKRRDDR